MQQKHVEKQNGFKCNLSAVATKRGSLIETVN